jgi:hypothetical protein
MEHSLDWRTGVNAPKENLNKCESFASSVSNVHMRPTSICLILVAILLSTFAAAQSKSQTLPCSFSGALLRGKDGQQVWFTTGQMKKRAIHKVDIGPALRQVDFKTTVLLDVLVSPSGEVVCVRTVVGLPMVRAETETALRAWTFIPAKQRGKPIAYLGRLQFQLCNALCEDQGISMTLLK